MLVPRGRGSSKDQYRIECITKEACIASRVVQEEGHAAIPPETQRRS